jgi:hypothetical protein
MEIFQDPLETLISMSGKSRQECLTMLEAASGDIETAAMYLLDLSDHFSSSEIYSTPTHAAPAPPPNTTTSLETPLSQDTKQTQQTLDDIDISSICARFHETQFNEYEYTQQEPHMTIKILIPQYRLQEVFEKITIPLMIQFRQIWTDDTILTIPGGMTICEILCHDPQDLESFLALLATQLCRYEMSLCFILDTITNRDNRREFIKQIQNLLPSLYGIEPHALHQEFHEQVSRLPYSAGCVTIISLGNLSLLCAS